MKSSFRKLFSSRTHAFLAIIALSLTLGGRSTAALTVDTLRCDAYVNPVGIDSAQPQLSWLPESQQRGETVRAYQIRAASSRANLVGGVADIWDSGKVLSDENVQILYGGPALTSLRQVFWQVRLWNGADAVSPWSAPASWTMGIMKTADWMAQWITPGTAATDAGSTLLRKTFTVRPGLTRAVVSVCGLGQYEITVNGTKASADFLSPGWTKYDKTILYNIYDVTSLLQTGTDAVGLMLGNGMYNIPANSGRYTKITQSYGARKAIAQIRLEYGDGSVQTIGTDATWKWSNGPIIFNTIYGGEDYDARHEQSGWNLPSFNDSSWVAAMVTTGPGGKLRGTSYSAPPVQVQQGFSPSTPALIGMAANVVYDFGQNASQIPTITVHGPAGATVTLYPSELGTAGANGGISQIVSPCYMTYTLKGSTEGSPEIFTPRFFYTGYRYLKVSLSGMVTLDALTSSMVRSNSDASGSFTCSNTLFNRIRALIRWAQQNNTVSIFTDCPTREKLGWLEEIYLNGPSLRYEFDFSALYTKAMHDMADSQTSGGVIPTTAPDYLRSSGSFGDTPEWGSSFILSAWQQYQFTGDTRALSQCYGAMQAFVDYLGTRSSGYIVNYGLGDWYDLGPGSLGAAQLTPVALTATATYYRDASVMAQIAQMLGKSADAAAYRTLADNIRTAFNHRFYNSATGNYSTGSQTAEAMPLELGMVDSANTSKVIAALVQNVRSHGNAMTSGDIGEGYLLRALTDYGRADVGFDMHSRITSPGYGYILFRGATSMTEGWDGSNSQDHFMLGEITEWFYHDLAGIQPDPAGPGFKKIIIKPTVVGNLTSASATYHSVRGMISSSWTINETQMTLDVTIPPATKAQVYLPTFATVTASLTIAESGTPIMHNGVAIGRVPGVTFQTLTAGTILQNAAVWSVDSGTYQFSWRIAPAWLPP